MISHIDETLKEFLKSEVPFPEKGKKASFDISFDIPTKEWAGRLSGTKGTLNIYLYEVSENRELRSNEWQIQEVSDGKVGRKWPVIRFDLFYLLTAWSPAQSDAYQDEHHLLSTVLATLFKFPTLPENYYQGEMITADLPYKIPLTCAGPSAFKEQGAGQFWSAIDQFWKPFIPLTVTIPVELQDKITGPVSKVYDKDIHLHNTSDVKKPMDLSGIVINSEPEKTPISGASLILFDADETVLAKTATAADGTFLFKNLTRDKYVVKVKAKGYSSAKVILNEVDLAKIVSAKDESAKKVTITLKS